MTKHSHMAAILTVAALIAFAPSLSTQARAQGTERGLLERLDSDADPLNTYAQADRLSGIKQSLRLSAEQEKLWAPVEEALLERRRALRSALATEEPTDQIEWLRRRAEVTTQRANALKKLADAMQPLWATLSDEQKRELTWSLAMAPSRTDQERRMGSRRDDDGGMPRRPYRDAWRYGDQDRTDRDWRDRDDAEQRYRHRDRMMGDRGGDQRDDRDDMRRDRFDRPAWRSQDDYQPRSRDFDRDRRDFDRRSDRDNCRCYRQD